MIIENKTGNGSQKGEKKGQRKTKEDLGGQCDRRGRGRPRKTWEDSVTDVARRKGKTLADMKRLARDRRRRRISAQLNCLIPV
jgi:hypothetical protein